MCLPVVSNPPRRESFALTRIIGTYGRLLTAAMGQTLLLALYGLFFACIIGMIVGIMSVLHSRVCRAIAAVFVNLIRGVPMIVLAYFIFFGIPYLWNTILGIGGLTLTALQAGSICLALNCGAYMAEIIRAGIESVDVGQMEAARSLGLPYWRAMHRVVLPQAIRTMIQHHQPVHHHPEGHLDPLRHRVPGAGQHREKRGGGHVHVLPDLGHRGSHVPDRHTAFAARRQGAGEEAEVWSVTPGTSSTSAT